MFSQIHEMAVQRASNFLLKSPDFFLKGKIRPNTEIFSLPERWRGGRIEKFVNYWRGVKQDYSEAFQGKRQTTLF